MRRTLIIIIIMVVQCEKCGMWRIFYKLKELESGITIEQEPRRFIYVKRADWAYPHHHKNVLLPGLGCGFVPEIP